MMGAGMDWGWGWMFSGGLMMLLFWSALIVLVVLAARGLGGGGGRSETSTPHREAARQTPLEIAQARYAKGEISRDEYETLRHDLQTS
jgi:putative membrane protein